MLKKNKVSWIQLDLLSVYSEGYVQTHLEIPDLKLRENQPFKTFWVSKLNLRYPGNVDIFCWNLRETDFLKENCV